MDDGGPTPDEVPARPATGEDPATAVALAQVLNADGTLHMSPGDAAAVAQLHPQARKVAQVLAGLGVAGTVRELPERANTAALAAAQLGVAVGAIANSLVFDADGRPLLVLTSGAHRADVLKLGALVGAAHVRRADADFVRHHTGQAIGGVGPVGHPSPLRTLVDVDLARFDTVWAAAGHAHYVFPTTYDELLRITAGEAAEVGELPLVD